MNEKFHSPEPEIREIDEQVFVGDTEFGANKDADALADVSVNDDSIYTEQELAELSTPDQEVFEAMQKLEIRKRIEDMNDDERHAVSLLLHSMSYFDMESEPEID